MNDKRRNKEKDRIKDRCLKKERRNKRKVIGIKIIKRGKKLISKKKMYKHNKILHLLILIRRNSLMKLTNPIHFKKKKNNFKKISKKAHRSNLKKSKDNKINSKIIRLIIKKLMNKIMKGSKRTANRKNNKKEEVDNQNNISQLMEEEISIQTTKS